jgi:hypothetical protein
MFATALSLSLQVVMHLAITIDTATFEPSLLDVPQQALVFTRSR